MSVGASAYSQYCGIEAGRKLERVSDYHTGLSLDTCSSDNALPDDAFVVRLRRQDVDPALLACRYCPVRCRKTEVLFAKCDIVRSFYSSTCSFCLFVTLLKYCGASTPFLPFVSITPFADFSKVIPSECVICSGPESCKDDPKEINIVRRVIN